MFYMPVKGKAQFVCILLCLCVGCRTVKPIFQEEYIRPGLNQEWHEAFEKSRQSITKGMSEDRVPGLSIALVDREGLIWSAGFGFTDYDCKVPVTPDTIFSIQSMSKTFTATAVMMAVQDRLVDLDAPISEYLPDFKIKSRFEENPEQKITLRHLLSHTAGFVHEAPVGNNLEHESPSFEAHIKSISDTWLKFPVGARESYSNLGIDLAAYIIELRSGRSFADYTKEKIFDPLDMLNSSMDMGFIRQHINRAIGHRPPHMKGTRLEIPMLAAGGVYTSANDLSRFIQFHLNHGLVDGKVIINKEVLENMFTPPLLGICAGTYTGNPNNPSGIDGSFSWNHGGGGFGFNSIMGWLPDYEMGVLVLVNSVKHNNLHGKSAFVIANEVVLNGLVKKKDSKINLRYEAIQTYNMKYSEYQTPDPDSFTPYKQEWKKYTGTYKHLDDQNLYIYARVALALGYPELNSKVYKKNGFLEIDGMRLDEYQPGVFFTANGDCLDFSGPIPLWKGLRIKKKLL